MPQAAVLNVTLSIRMNDPSSFKLENLSKAMSPDNDSWQEIMSFF